MTDDYTFHPVIAEWFAGRFAEPSPPQKQGWPEIAAGRHTLILAPTGSGKTLAAFLWSIDELFRLRSQDSGRRGDGSVHTLYVSPLKALNNDIHRNLQEPLKGIRRQARKMGVSAPEIQAMVRTGDTPSHVRQAMLKRPPHILITTPESLYLLLTSERGREMFRNLRYVIIDEIHAISGGKRGVHLSLSLERLMPLCEREPVRIGLSATQRPLARIAAFLGGQKHSQIHRPPNPRPVSIINCGQRKQMDLRVLSPVENFNDLPEASVWPAVIEKLYDLICSHRTTLVFVNIRSQAERVARQLNELRAKLTGDSGAQIALAHHGSISREMRYDIEARLKEGEIPAVIATASLELGIDIGSIDLVVQLASPRSVAGGMQRVGRSGHLLSATSKGRIIPLYQSDLDDAVAMTRLMHSGDIEETVIPENCLDVLAQQIVAEVAMQDWPREALYGLVTRSYCYRNLTIDVFNRVLEMLAGRFADAPLRALQPRISWDRVNDRLIGMRGARLLATMNGGTIPDRGYYAVYLADSNVRLGEMEEEFVFESRVGHVFFLGNNEWHIDAIQQDRIVVSPVRAVKPRAPFWKGDLLFRQFESCQKIGAMRTAFLQQSNAHAEAQTEGAAGAITKQTAQKLDGIDEEQSDIADRATLKNLQNYLNRQQEATQYLPTDKLIVGEWFRDSADEPHFIIHTCFGARVNGLWAIALAAAMEKKYGVQVQFAYDDDSLILRALDTTENLPVESLLALPASEVRQLLESALIDTPVFAIHFRYNAARALILSRSRPGKRIPLWLQRLRAADLLQVTRQYPDFPIVVETYRDCLQDVFDWRGLQQVVDDLGQGRIRVHIAHTRAPSPMAAGVMFNFLAENMYEMDRSRLPGQAATVSSELLAQILDQEEIPAIVTPELVTAAEARWQHLAPEFHAADAEELFAVIDKLSPLRLQELQQRSKLDPAPWLAQLHKEGRIKIDAGLYMPAHGAGDDMVRLRRFLHVRGPRSSAQISQSLDLHADRIHEMLQTLHGKREVVTGRLLQGRDEEVWCDRQNFAELYRRAVARRREATRPATRPQWLQFQLLWHRVAQEQQAIPELVARYAAYALPAGVFECEILRSRLCGADQSKLTQKLSEFENQLATGQVVTRVRQYGGEGRLLQDFILRGTGNVFHGSDNAGDKPLSGEAHNIYAFLKENGASFLRDLISGTGLSAVQVQQALNELARLGLVTSESYPAFMAILQPNSAGGDFASAPESPSGGEEQNWLPQPAPAWTRSRRRVASRRAIRATVREQIQHADSRWLLTQSFGVMGPPVSTKEQVARQARLLLQRYGILVKEWYRLEQGMAPWHQIFQVLKRLEWQGEIRRGYFVDGLSGMQFALPQAVELLERIQTDPKESELSPVLLSTMDPALPLGNHVDWQLQDGHGNALRVVRAPANHLVLLNATPVFYSENYGSRLWRLAKIPQRTLNACVDLFKTWLRLPARLRPRRRVEIAEINGKAAGQCKLAEVFVQNGFERHGEKLVLWPSGAE